jgi:hypothetical protein
LVVLERFKPIEPLFAPVVPVALALTIQVAVGAVPDTVEIEGAVPPRFAVARAKLPAVTPFTGSEKVTVQASEVALVGLAPLTLIDATVGGVVSPGADVRTDFGTVGLLHPPRTAFRT